MRLNDFILLAVLAVSMAVGVFLPEIGRPAGPFVRYFVMGLLFMSFLSIKIADVRRTAWTSRYRILYMALIKLIILPVLVYFGVKAVLPEYALASLLLAGISTGVVAPFIAGLVGANAALVLAVVVVTSFIAPFSLPALVKILAGRQMNIPLGPMIVMLAQVIFIPMLVVECLHRFSPRTVLWLRQRGFPISLTFFALINLGVFSVYSKYFLQNPMTAITALGVAVFLAFAFVFIGLMLFRRGLPEDRMAAATALCNVNNILVVVFAADFFGPLEPTLAALYLFPFFGAIIPLRIFKRWKERA